MKVHRFLIALLPAAAPCPAAPGQENPTVVFEIRSNDGSNGPWFQWTVAPPEWEVILDFSNGNSVAHAGWFGSTGDTSIVLGNSALVAGESRGSGQVRMRAKTQTKIFVNTPDTTWRINADTHAEANVAAGNASTAQFRLDTNGAARFLTVQGGTASDTGSYASSTKRVSGTVGRTFPEFPGTTYYQLAPATTSTGASVDVTLPYAGNANSIGSATITVTSCPPCDTPRAYVLVGEIEDGALWDEPLNRLIAVASAGAAAMDYAEAGYEVFLVDPATPGDFIDAVNDGCTRAIWVLAHGGYELEGDGRLGGPVPSLALFGGRVDPTLLNANPCIEDVTIHACSQDLPGWRAVFPTASATEHFVAWTTPVRLDAIYLWQRLASYAPVEVPAIHPRLHQVNQFGEDDVFFAQLGPVANTVYPFIMHEPLASELDGVVFNYLARLDQEDALLYSATLSDGVIDIESARFEYDANAAFDLIVDEQTLRQLLEDPDSWPIVSTDSTLVEVVDYTGGSIPEQDVLRAMGYVQHGVNPCPGDCHNTDGVVDVQDLLALLNQWGAYGGCESDGDEVVGVSDLLLLMANWGACPLK